MNKWLKKHGGHCHDLYGDLLLEEEVTGMFNSYEPPRGKTNNVVSEQVRHKPACTSTEKS